jgi:hypothetical protein
VNAGFATTADCTTRRPRGALAHTPVTTNVVAVVLEFLMSAPQTCPNGIVAETFTRSSGDDAAKPLPPIGTVPFGHRTVPLDSAPGLAVNCFEMIL